MPEIFERSTSVYDYSVKRKKHPKIHRSRIRSNIEIIGGIALTIITIILHCIAYSTPHWKEISPNTHSLYIDSIDALIRTETLVYFNSVHRFTRHSYGLFQRCEYHLPNSSILLAESVGLNFPKKRCTKNFLPYFPDEKFNECHSLQYYRFCAKTSEKIFNINNDYLRATFHISTNSDLKSSCDCSYPSYLKACQIVGIFALIFLILTASFFTTFPFLKTRLRRLKIKCFGVLSSLMATLFIIINLSVALNSLEYESIEYLAAIERHYRISQIYKLSQDVKHAINRFQSSIDIKLGYSAQIAWIVFALSIIDGILLMLTCKITSDDPEIDTRFEPVSSEEELNTNDVNQSPTTPLRSSEKTTISPFPAQPHHQASSRSFPTNEGNKQSSVPGKPFPPSCLKHSHSPRIHFGDEV